MKNFTCYLVDKRWDELSNRPTSARIRTDGPIRVNSLGMVFTQQRFVTVMKRVDYYLMYLTEGRLSYHFEDGICEASAGDFVIIPPMHTIHYEERYGSSLSYYLTHFSGTDAERLLDSLGFSAQSRVYTVGPLMQVQEEYDRMFDCYNRGSAFLAETVATGFQRILLMLAQKLNDPIILKAPQNAIYYINRRLEDRITVAELARLENMSESRFYTVFKAATGRSPIDYINDLRITRACNLIQSMPMRINEIADAVGFSDICFFSKQFKRRMGMSPTEYKRQFS